MTEWRFCIRNHSPSVYFFHLLLFFSVVHYLLLFFSVAWAVLWGITRNRSTFIGSGGCKVELNCIKHYGSFRMKLVFHCTSLRVHSYLNRFTYFCGMLFRQRALNGAVRSTGCIFQDEGNYCCRTAVTSDIEIWMVHPRLRWDVARCLRTFLPRIHVKRRSCTANNTLGQYRNYSGLPTTTDLLRPYVVLCYSKSQGFGFWFTICPCDEP